MSRVPRGRGPAGGRTTAGGGHHSIGLVLIEFIHGHMHPDYGAGAVAKGQGRSFDYFYDRCRETVIPNARRLGTAISDIGGTTAVTATGTQFGDFRDVAPGVRPVIRAREHRVGSVAMQLMPGIDELNPLLVLKAGSGAWATTNIDDVLRNAGVRELYFAGVHTHGAVLMSAQWAWDLGLDVTVVSDACATLGKSIHERGLEVMADLGLRVRSTDEVLVDLNERQAAPRSTR